MSVDTQCITFTKEHLSEPLMKCLCFPFVVQCHLVKRLQLGVSPPILGTLPNSFISQLFWTIYSNSGAITEHVARDTSDTLNCTLKLTVYTVFTVCQRHRRTRHLGFFDHPTVSEFSLPIGHQPQGHLRLQATCNLLFN